MSRFDLHLLKRTGAAPPDTVAMARLRAEEAPHPDLKPLGRKYVSGVFGWDRDDFILFGLLVIALAGGVAGVVGLLV